MTRMIGLTSKYHKIQLKPTLPPLIVGLYDPIPPNNKYSYLSTKYTKIHIIPNLKTIIRNKKNLHCKISLAYKKYF